MAIFAKNFIKLIINDDYFIITPIYLSDFTLTKLCPAQHSRFYLYFYFPMAPKKAPRAGAANTRSGGNMSRERPLVEARAPAPLPATEVVEAATMEGTTHNAGALQALKPRDDIDQVLVNSSCLE